MSRKKIAISELNLKKIGGRIAHIRISNGMNQEEFCNITGLTKGNLSCLENNKYEPSYQAIVKILENFEIDSGWLLFGDSDPPSKDATASKGVSNTLDPDPEINDLLKKTRAVLVSKTSYAESLKANVNSFHESVKAREEIKTMRSEINYLKNHIITDRRKEDRRGPSSKGRIIESIDKDRREGKDRRKSGLGE
ncbi:MAG: helix-turn-helix transcriptional regulator [Pseudomonadota bacterium]